MRFQLGFLPSFANQIVSRLHKSVPLTVRQLLPNSVHVFQFETQDPPNLRLLLIIVLVFVL